jgi:hypothetical protein
MVKLSKKKAAGIGAKDTFAIALITTGVSFINQGDYLTGGAFVVGGWILLVVDKFIEHD